MAAFAGVTAAAVVVMAAPGSVGPANADPDSEANTTSSTTSSAVTTVSGTTSASAPATGN
ncbi:hypothetical protein [Mycobacterium sp. SMC-19]|uniref:hypothetical protein n=1 Tax=Mycobacterium sp. SMC-19 TaxID=3381630 RepID=UPI003876D93F